MHLMDSTNDNLEICNNRCNYSMRCSLSAHFFSTTYSLSMYPLFSAHFHCGFKFKAFVIRIQLNSTWNDEPNSIRKPKQVLNKCFIKSLLLSNENNFLEKVFAKANKFAIFQHILSSWNFHLIYFLFDRFLLCSKNASDQYKTHKIIISYAEVQSIVKLIIRKGVCACVCQEIPYSFFSLSCLLFIYFFFFVCFVGNIIRTFITVNGWVAFSTLCNSFHVSNVFRP